MINSIQNAPTKYTAKTLIETTQNTNPSKVFENSLQVSSTKKHSNQKRYAHEIADDIFNSLGRGFTWQKGIDAIYEINADNVIQVWNLYQYHLDNYKYAREYNLAHSIMHRYDKKLSKKLMKHLVTALRDNAFKQKIDVKENIREYNEALKVDVPWWNIIGKFDKDAHIVGSVTRLAEKINQSVQEKNTHEQLQ